MKLKRSMKEVCYLCGARVDQEEAIFLITRIDPHTHVLRRAEPGEAPASLSEAMKLGFRVSVMCQACADEESGQSQ